LWISGPNGKPFVDGRVIRGTSVTGIGTTCPNRMGSNRPAEWKVMSAAWVVTTAEWAVTDPQNGQ